MSAITIKTLLLWLNLRKTLLLKTGVFQEFQPTEEEKTGKTRLTRVSNPLNHLVKWRLGGTRPGITRNLKYPQIIPTKSQT